jgi:hypothetical protein
MEDDLWVRVICDFASAHRRNPIERGHLLRSLAPLYMARVASFVLEVHSLNAAEVEDRIERLCQCFEDQKPYLRALWAGTPDAAGADTNSVPRRSELEVEV